MVNIKNRFLIIKQIYNDYIIFIKRKDDYYTFASDTEILEYIKYKKMKDLNRKKINYLILDNLEIIKKYEYKGNNKYKEYLLKTYIDKIMKKILEGIQCKKNI